MAFRYRADVGPTFEAGLVALFFFQGIRTSIAKKSYIFVILQRWDPLPLPFGSAHAVCKGLSADDTSHR